MVIMTRKLTLFAVCAFEVVLILFVVAWTAWAGQRTENGVIFYDGTHAEVIITNGKILAKHVSRGKRARDPIVVFYSISYGRSAVKRIYVCEQWDISLTCRRNK